MYTGGQAGIQFVYRSVGRNTVCIQVGGQEYSLYTGRGTGNTVFYTGGVYTVQ